MEGGRTLGAGDDAPGRVPRLRANACGSGHHEREVPARAQSRGGLGTGAARAGRGEEPGCFRGAVGGCGARATPAQQELSPRRSEDRERAQQMLSTFLPVASSLGSFLLGNPFAGR